MNEVPSDGNASQNSNKKEAVLIDAEQFLKDACIRMEQRLSKLRGEEANDSPFNAYASRAFSQSRSLN